MQVTTPWNWKYWTKRNIGNCYNSSNLVQYADVGIGIKSPTAFITSDFQLTTVLIDGGWIVKDTWQQETIAFNLTGVWKYKLNINIKYKFAFLQ